MQRRAPLGHRLPRSIETLCALALLGAGETSATTFVPMTVGDLTRSSTAVVIGTVESVESFESEDGGIKRRVRIAVEQTVAGEVAPGPLVLEELGGRAGGRREVVFGAPSYSTGEPVLVFVETSRRGTLRTSQMALGKFRLEDGLATRALGRGSAVAVSPSGTAWRASIPVDELLAEIASASGSEVESARQRGAVASSDGALPRPEFNLFSPAGRFFEVDEGDSIDFLIDQHGDDILGLEAARQSVDDAFAAWTGVGAARITLTDVGLTADLAKTCVPGNNKIRFNDPDDEISDPVDCSGVLGVGGFCSVDSDLKHFGGVDFQRAVRALVTFADHWEGCDDWTACNVAEVATHEIGHSIGFAHSSNDPNEDDPELRDATMYFRTHFDGRCAGLRSDDVAAVTFVYPLSTPPTITTAAQLPPATFNVPYRQELAATGGAGSFTWRLDPPCTGVPGLDLTPGGVIQGTSTVIGSGCFTVTATDADGDSHTKRFDIELPLEPPTPTNTARPETPTPTPTTTPTATLAPLEVCAGDCGGDRAVSIDEIIAAVRAALGAGAPCAAIDVDSSGTVTIDEVVAAVAASIAGCTPT